MEWQQPWETFYTFVIGAFLCVYIIYVWRKWVIARSTGGAFRAGLVKFILRAAAVTLGIIALLGPSWGVESREIQIENKDLFFCVDLSRSMDARDIAPSRIGKVKYMLQDLLPALEGERVGLIIFSSEAFIQCPLTTDFSALGLFVDAMNTSLVPQAGTNLAAPLEMARKRLINQQEKNTIQPAAQAVILISDGEDFSGDALAAAEALEEASIRLFTVGIGTEQGSEIPIAQGVKRDPKTGEIVRSRINATMLKRLAAQTNGDYFEITNNTSKITLINRLQEIKGTTRLQQKELTAHNKYRYFLLTALALLILDLLIPITRKVPTKLL